MVWRKDITGSSVYDCISKDFKLIEPAIQYIEDNELEDKLRENVIDLWEEIQDKFKIKRKKKKRR